MPYVIICALMKNYFKLLKFLKGHEKLFFLAVGTMFIASFFEVFQLSLLAPMTDRIFNNNQIIIPNELPKFFANKVEWFNTMDPKKLFPFFLVGFFVLLLIKNILVFTYQYLMGDVSQRIMRDIRYKLYVKIHSLSLDYFSEKRTGELVSRITHDANILENAVSYGVTDLFRQTFIIIMWITTAFMIDPQAACIIFLIFPFIGIPMSKIGKKLKVISRGLQEKMADINSLLLETISGVKLVKAFCTEDYEINRFKGENHGYYKLRMKATKRLIIISPITEIVGGLCGVFLILWFGKRLMTGELSFGVFILFFASIMSVISPIKKLGNVNALTQQALAANERIYEILDAQPSVKEKKNAQVLSEMQNAIQIKDVNFQYDQESGLILKGINLEIKKGELVAIVGPTGTGKTTLASLIPRFYDPTEGMITIDGVNLKDVSFQSLREQIGIVTQETILFNDTVKANISYGHQSATQEEIEEVAKKAFAHRFIVKTPNGYDTTIGDRGFRLSGGEKQRLAIARAILKNPPILILDEATSQLDSESEKFVQEALDKLMKGRTVIAIAHRLSTIKKANKIVVIDDGHIVGQGRHEDLLTTCPLYERLHRVQFQG
ncbi:Lipid A export permease/ATP-binding protein MsbA [hydrothermal vent metagenome]|uniref:Lipid A export permease/ATP-binding protein MsbA n=1 Tax=hydrothermal vent metagenome TaxID=652676 RepID=A0A3B1DMI1_9ZZZZ